MTRITQFLTLAGLPAVFALSLGSATSQATYAFDQCYGSYGDVMRCCLKNTSPQWLRRNAEHCEEVVICKTKSGRKCYMKRSRKTPNLTYKDTSKSDSGDTRGPTNTPDRNTPNRDTQSPGLD